MFVAPDGTEKHYVASDHVRVDNLEVLTPQDLLELALLRDLHFDQTRLVGPYSTCSLRCPRTASWV